MRQPGFRIRPSSFSISVSELSRRLTRKKSIYLPVTHKSSSARFTLRRRYKIFCIALHKKKKKIFCIATPKTSESLPGHGETATGCQIDGQTMRFQQTGESLSFLFLYIFCFQRERTKSSNLLKNLKTMKIASVRQYVELLYLQG
jgi:hypothetical protein